METQHDIMVTNKRNIQYKFSIKRKITIIRGDSATGKTTLFQMVDDASKSNGTGITISCDVPLKAMHETGYKYELENEHGNIYIFDEDFSHLRSKEFASCVMNSDNCFIFITRESLPTLSYSYAEIYSIKASGKFHSFERVYPDCNHFIEMNSIVTEDEDAGLEYYQHYFGNKVKSSHGNSNLSKYGSSGTLLIGDGSAIGAYIQDLWITKSQLYLPESFEWVLLNSNMFSNIKSVKQLLGNSFAAVNTTFRSVEQYYTNLLTEITRNTPAQYSKSKLNACYVYDCCCKNTKCEFFTKSAKDANWHTVKNIEAQDKANVNITPQRIEI